MQLAGPVTDLSLIEYVLNTRMIVFAERCPQHTVQRLHRRRRRGFKACSDLCESRSGWVSSPAELDDLARLVCDIAFCEP